MSSKKAVGWLLHIVVMAAGVILVLVLMQLWIASTRAACLLIVLVLVGIVSLGFSP